MQQFRLLAFACIILLSCFSANAQHSFKAVVKNEQDQPLAAATAVIQQLNRSAVADSNGVVIVKDLPAGVYAVLFSHVGYETKTVSVQLPMAADSTFVVILEEKEHEEEEEIIITSTRTSRYIANIPTRIETISGEELEEKGNMKPGDIRMMLNESTGIQTQQTSATSYNSSIRIQGLDGKYTQLLRDGFPLYSGFSGGLGLLQIVPLDLKQVEVIKGASSTLYGGGAIAGLVNLVSRTPGEERQLNFLLNGTSALGLDASGFYSQKFKKVGTTLFASFNVGTPYDPADIGLTAIPKFRRYTVNPKLFLYLNERSTINIGVNGTFEDRVGGDLNYIKDPAGNSNLYFEENKTTRISTQAGYDYNINPQSKFSLKNSVSFYKRSIAVPGFRFAGLQTASFSEASYRHENEQLEWITGMNLWTDQFSQNDPSSGSKVNYTHTTVGLFVQNTWNATEQFILETGVRGDYQNQYGFFALPRISALYKFTSQFSMRVGGGLGYKTPTVFTEDAERIQFRNVMPIDVANTKAEESIGGNLDLNYKTKLGEEVELSINTLFFYTKVNNPLVLVADVNNLYRFQQPNGFIDTKGMEANVKISYADFKLFIGYTLADVQQRYNGNSSTFPLVAKHRLNNVLMYEIEEKLKLGLEAYYFSKQQLNDGATGKPYWICGFMAEKLWERFSVFINFENFLNTKQTRFDTIYTGSINNPSFRDIYAPVDGFVVNGGIKIRL
ncbi:TonB-dependent receptor [Lacibacter sediminis]|uniref:TonB-dependent receptor n=1 Tax=Lacibacter sediminis TaxID=2760713 RepID=A0A7G5XGM0_9BACT|nr:TonB-dependent receptor [Lacibacter sediminis]QNA44623.1 TonB-dependent receptor [Lacibacter sediminis]